MMKSVEIRSTDGQQEQQTKIPRHAKESDILAILRIEQNSSLHPWTEAAFHSEFNNPYSRLWVIEEGALVIGYVCAWFIYDDGQIANVAVLPCHRHRGL